MIKLFKASFFIFFLPLFVFFSPAAADSVKLDNGSYFEGKIIDETPDTIVFQMEIGTVTFKKSEVVEAIVSPGYDNMKMEKSWDERNPDAPLSDDEKVEKYINRGKVKYQGRWVSEDVYNVLEREKDIKEKRYRYLQQKEKEEAQRQLHQEKKRIQKDKEEAKRGLGIRSEDGEDRFRTFGKSRSELDQFETRKFSEPPPSSEKEIEAPIRQSLGQTASFGSRVSKPFVTTSNPYEK